MSAVLHRNLKVALPTAVSGEGVYLKDQTDQLYIDASGGAGVSSLGHSNDKVIQAIQWQIEQLACVHTSFFTNEPSEALATYLINKAPEGFASGKVAFVGSGSEAMEVAIKLARQYHVERGELQRVHLISRHQSYHGNTLGALAVGGNPMRREIYQPMLMTTSQISPCFAYRFQQIDETEEDYALRAANELEVEINHLGKDKVAAFIAEPVVGATIGCVTAAKGYFSRIREICDHYGVLFIADEVMCGMGRTGSLFAVQQENCCPDIITLAKGLGAGYQPIAAVMASESVVSALYDGSGLLANGHTYMSHPVACAGALAVLKVIEDENLLSNVVRQGQYLKDELIKQLSGHPFVGDVRGRGLFVGIELVKDKQTKQPFDKHFDVAQMFKQIAFNNGLICYPTSGTADGINGDHILLAPPFIIKEKQIDEIIFKLKKSLKICFEKLVN
ncbi:aspartate aminotransferase family protein [Aliikangiella sp. IMCC44359]|uniref:aspartate aminotransferase family protein n=1 Tax=Aliikangiella sp. IMCC44359 TaxID=3459125 RepID=UPI00403B327D